MPSVTINFTIDGDEELREDIFSTTRQVKSFLTPLRTQIVEDIYQMYRDRFHSEGSYGGSPWAPLAPATIAWKEARGKGHKTTLRLNDNLYDSLTRYYGTKDSEYDVNHFHLTVGTSVPYAKAHQEGYTVRPFGNPHANLTRVPARPIVPEHIPARRRSEWVALLAQHATAYLKVEGRGRLRYADSSYGKYTSSSGSERRYYNVRNAKGQFAKFQDLRSSR